MNYKQQLKTFTFDFEALYDSLTPALVLKSVKFAIDKCRTNWGSDFSNWFLKNIEYSIKFANGVYKDNWYRPVNGIPTHGSLSVQLANIAVYYVFFLL